MKTTITLLKIAFAILILSMISCSSDDSGTPDNEPINSGELKLFVIDTAKVNTISRTGTNEVTILNKMVNLNSYIGDFCLSPDGTSFIYTNHQNANGVSVDEIRKANADGSGDQMIYTVTDNASHIGMMRYCSDGKIFFVLETFFPNATRTLHLMNANGSGLETLNGNYDVIDLTDDRRYYLLPFNSGVNILDREGDGGFGGPYHLENIDTAESIEDGVFTNDGKYAVIPFKEANAIKVRIVEMATKTSETVTLVSGLGTGWISYHLEMASDGKRGVVTLTGEDYPKSKTYVFNAESGVVEAPFENNDETVYDVYVF